tara:strand:+ start:428 stop:562 length:135 start_codon:yes stop_codon:yes gene_type:complete
MPWYQFDSSFINYYRAVIFSVTKQKKKKKEKRTREARGGGGELD